MLEAKLILTSGGEFELSLRGHAEHAPTGSDTVCAAASILAYTAAQEVLEMERRGKLRGKPHIALDKGHSEICCEYKESATGEAKALYRIVGHGYDLLAANFPKNVHVTTF